MPDLFPLSGLAPEQLLRRLELRIVQRLDGFLYGEHLGLLPGPGTETAETRIYSPGEDDVRRMDWLLTARTTIPHVRDVIADRELEIWAFVDLTASMDFSTRMVTKRDLAIAAVATLALLTFRNGDRFGGYVLTDGRLERLPVRPGRAALVALVRTLLDASGGDHSGAGFEVGEAIGDLVRTQRKRGLRIVVSDFIDASPVPDSEPPAWERPMCELASRHQVIAVEVIDPAELDLPAAGTVVLRDPESGAVHEVNTANPRLRQRYADAARRQRSRTASALRRAGAAHLVLRTDRDWVSDLARFSLLHRRTA